MVTARQACGETNRTAKQNKKQTSLLQAALQYAAEGFRIVPCHSIRNGKCSCSKVCRKPGKHPRIEYWPTRASCDATQITKWFAKWPDSNFGLATGAGSGVIAFDFDGEEGHQTLDQLTTVDPKILETRIHQTGGGGAHLIYQYPGFEVANSVRLLPGMDLRGDRGLIILPPSFHMSGERYVARNSLPIASLPPVLFQTLRDGGFCCHKESSGVLKGVEEKQSELKQEKMKEEGPFQPLPNVLPEQIELALRESVPHGSGKRNRQVFQLARHLQAIDGITKQISANAFRRVAERWHQMLLDEAAKRGFSVTGDFEETWADFRFAWTRVKHPVGQTLQPVFDKVVKMDSDGEVSRQVWNSLEYFSRTETQSMRLIVGVLYELSLQAGDAPFSLACDAGAFQLRRVGVPEASGKWLHRRLLNLIADGVIACVDRGKSGNQSVRKSAKFVWTWTMREPPSS